MHGLEQQKMQTWYNISKLVFFSLLLLACSAQNDSVVDEENSTLTVRENLLSSSQEAWYLNSQVIQGRAQGTTYTVKTSDDSLLVTPSELANFFNSFDEELSTYIDNSLISQLNSNKIERVELGKTDYFNTVYQISRDVSEITLGAFDPTVFPLVEKWGFFKNPHDSPSKEEIDSLLQFVGMADTSCFSLSDNMLYKNDPRSKLDFNAIAQGQSVDEVAKILDAKGQKNYFIEVGGEIVAKGQNDRQTDWVIGIDEPLESNDGKSGDRKLENLLKISGQAVATSGSYRKFYVKNGKRYSHTIDPKTGYPVEHNLLSVTVVGPSAAKADAYATAFMTLGVEKTMEFIEENESLGLNVYLLFENKSGRIERAYSKEMERFFLN
jgi:thiamine biosynthesis lipoprotein